MFSLIVWGSVWGSNGNVFSGASIAFREQQGWKGKRKAWGIRPQTPLTIKNSNYPGSEFEMILAYCMDYVCGKGKA